VRRDLAEEGIIIGVPEDSAEETGGGLQIRLDGDDGAEAECQVDDFSISGPEWLKRRLTPERLVHICEQVKKDKGRQFLQNLYDNMPIALIVLLPLFFVHFHAFMFLILTLQILIGRLNSALPTPEAIGILLIVAASFYVPVYLFVAMRRVYGQGRLLTTAKYVALTVAYLAGFTMTMLGAVTMAAFSV
jgi:hypothetical protein